MAISIHNFQGNDWVDYTKKAHNNLAFFDSMLDMFLAQGNYTRKDVNDRLSSLHFTPESLEEINYIARKTGISAQRIQAFNAADEVLNSFGVNLFGCTSVVSTDNDDNMIIGQTLDLFALDLVVVRKPGVVYVTMPPYSALLGRNENIAFCTNHLSHDVEWQGRTPISNVRNGILQFTSLRAVKDLVTHTAVTTAANFLITDGTEACNIEVKPKGSKIFTPLNKRDNGRFLAHTNHFLDEANISEDSKCRLSRATELLTQGNNVRDILNDPQIKLPIQRSLGTSFGTIITVIMDVRKGTFGFIDPADKKYVEIKVE